MQEQTRNLILAVVLGFVIIFGTQLLFAPRGPQPTPTQAEREAPAQAPAEAVPPAEVVVPASREEAIARAPRVPIETPSLIGSIRLAGARFDDLELLRYRQTVDPDSGQIPLLSPSGTADAYFSEFGWLASEEAIRLPGPETVWQASGERLTPESPLTLRWDNGEGLIFTTTISVDKDYLFTVTREAENTGEKPVTLWPYQLISRSGEGSKRDIPYSGYLVHLGPAGAFEGTLKEVDYEDIREEGRIRKESTGGWIGITDKYWLVALVPDQQAHFNASFFHTRQSEFNKYQVDLRRDGLVVAPGDRAALTDHLFAGAKEVNVLDRYEERLNVPRLDSVVFKFLWFLAKPLFYALNFFNGLFGNFGLAILALTICVRTLLFPLANKSYTAMSKMRKLQPQVMKLKDRFKGDKQRMNKEMMELYRREKVNPMAGCLPVLLQIPVFFSLYSVLFVAIEMRHTPFYGWIKDLSAPDPYSVFNLFGLLPIDLPQWLMIGPWPLLMGLTMWLQFKLNPTPTEPIQARIMMILPIVFTFILANFPAGLIIYWAWNNALSIAQQWIIMRRMGVKLGGAQAS